MSFAKAIAEIQSCKRSLRVVSKRKEKRWDNANLVGASLLLSSLSLTDDCINEGQNILLGQDNHHDGFKTILESRHADRLSLFVSCKEDQLLVEKKPSLPKKTVFNAPKQWEKIDRRLKEITAKTLSSSSYLFQFVYSIELLLLSYKSKQLVSEDIIQDIKDIVSIVVLPPASQSEQNVSDPIDTDTPAVQKPSTYAKLNLTFTDQAENLALFRLLLHTVCKFHGMKSQSVSNEEYRIMIPIKNVKNTTDVLTTRVPVDVTGTEEEDYVVVSSSSIATTAGNIMPPEPPILCSMEECRREFAQFTLCSFLLDNQLIEPHVLVE